MLGTDSGSGPPPRPGGVPVVNTRRTAQARTRGGRDSAGQPLDVLLDLVGHGDLAAFTQLYDRTAARVYGLIRAILLDRDLAQEVTQEVYLEIWRRASVFDPAKGVAISWIFTLAHSRAIDRVRSVQSMRTNDGTFARNSYYPDINSAAEIAERTENGHRVRAVLAQLTPLQQQAIHLAYYLGYTSSQASKLLGVPATTFKARLHSALGNLRRITRSTDADR